jgi:signal peptidase
VLLLVLIVPLGNSGRVLGAAVLLPAAALVYYFIKKRSVLSMHKDQVLMLMSVISTVYLVIYYLSGFYFGFSKSPYGLSFNGIFFHALPIAIIVVSSEIVRSVVIAQEDKASSILCYVSCIVAEMLTCSTFHSISSFNNFMDMVGLTFFPAVVANILYHYLSERYGMYPNIVFRLATTLHLYVIPMKSGVSDALLSFANLMVPIAIYIFIDSLYEKKKRYALGKKSKLEVPITVIAVAIMLFVVMVVSNQFVIGAYVIATPSMTGELNKGDAAIYERYDDQVIEKGQVIVFEKDDSHIIHRVVKIEIINGQTRYYTKGDANENVDAGFIYDSNIIGLVNFKIPYIGFPTLWLRSLFVR